MESAGCNTAPFEPPPVDDWMEKEVIMGFRIWQLMFLALAGLITVVVLLCCFMKCRVPRTKQEIEADFKRKEITRRFRFLLDRVQIEDTSLRTAIEKVNDLYMNREKTKRRKKKKATIEEEEIISIDSSYLFEDEKLTFIERVKKMVGLIKEDGSDSEADSQKDKSEKSEDNVTKPASDEDDAGSLPNVHTTKARQFSEESRESTDSPKLLDSQSKLIDSHSKLSLLHDSPPATHDTLSKLSFLQDSPPNNGLSLLQDTPPNARKQLVKEESGATTTDSQDSKKSSSGKQKTESQESHDSDQLPTAKKKQDSSQDSNNSSSRSPRPKLSFILSTKGKLKKSADSQDSEDSQLARQKSDSQDSGNEWEKAKKQKSDSQDSNESEGTKNKKMSEPRDPKLMRRESTGAQDYVHKWGQRPSQLNKLKGSQKETQSLDVTSTPR